MHGNDLIAPTHNGFLVAQLTPFILASYYLYICAHDNFVSIDITWHYGVGFIGSQWDYCVPNLFCFALNTPRNWTNGGGHPNLEGVDE
jgi:hypothetical protein